MEEPLEWLLSVCEILYSNVTTTLESAYYVYQCVGNNVQIWMYTPNGRYLTQNVALLGRLSTQTWLQLQNYTYGGLIRMLPAPYKVPIDESWELLDFNGRSALVSTAVDLYEPHEFEE